MADSANCPDQNTLERLLEGFLPDDTAVGLEEHLLDCERCCERARRLASATEQGKTDAIARTAVELADERAVIEIAERVGMLRLPEHSAAHTETISSGIENTLHGWDFGQILSPPESEGELGRFGAYRVLRVLGSGGMGLVWEAEDTQLRRRVALKVMKPSLADHREHRERFLREARAAAAIDHSHIVTVYQVGEHRGLPFLAMQLLHGETLQETLRREGPLPEAECLRIGRQMAEALGVAHRRGLIHRDIKPANTWLEADGGWVKLVDFGLAQATADESHLTQTGVILGTPAFMSPEQARGDAVDPRSDLFSLGAVFYRMATGVGPFDGPTTLAVLTALALRTPIPPRQVNPAISPAFSDLIVRLLAKTPNDRPGSADAVVEAIRAIEQTTRGPAKTSNGQPSGQRRRRWPWVAAAAAAAALLAGIIVIIRNRDGNEVGRYPVPDEGSVTVLPAHGRRVAPAHKEDDLPFAVSEPLPLEQWLKGRKVLTVAKDGSGQFQTIQAAMDALQPGQVVEVLDRGPYQETLLVANPRNAGLISRAGTIIEPGPKRREFGSDDTANFHYFAGVQGFRLNGISFVADDLAQLSIATYWVQCTLDGDLLVENCHFSSERPQTQELMVIWNGTAPAGTVCHLRECLFDTAPFINTSERPPKPMAVIERNWFRRTSLCLHGPGQTTVLRHNVFDTTASNAFTLYHESGIERLEIYNNTVGAWMLASQKMATTGVVVRNNLFRDGMTFGNDGAQESLAEVVQGWQVDHNEYAQAPGLTDQLPKSAGDFVGKPHYLSGDSRDSDYLRLASNSDEAHRGIGGAWPTYLGALPPGPAPKEGDWFTRLIRVAPKLSKGIPSDPPSATSADPPSLDQWLVGRKILTVSQDGNGQFRTIQDALDALRPGEAVEVLDRGPYRETLHISGPQNAGLVSRVDTVIELTGQRKPTWDQDPANDHFFGLVKDFRLSGLSFVAGDLKEFAPTAVWMTLSPNGDLLIENCHFAHHRPENGGYLIYWPADAPPEGMCRIRQCRFETSGTINVTGMGRESVAVIERNWFPRSLMIHGAGQRVVVRHNIFDGDSSSGLSLLDTDRIARLEVYNNTMLSRIFAHNNLPATGVVLRNNLLLGEGVVAGPDGLASLAAAVKGWIVGNNEYAMAPASDFQFPKMAADSVGDPRFLSRDPTDARYLRIAADSDEAHRGTGGAWPAYLGALPPGPADSEGDWLTRWIDRQKRVDSQ